MSDGSIRRSVRLLLLLVVASSVRCGQEKPPPTKLDHDSKFLIQLGLSDYRAGRLESALRNLEQAKIAAPQDSQAIYLLGVVLIERGEYDRAVRELDESLTLHPSDAELLNCRGIAKLRQGRAQDAIADFQAALAPELHYGAPESVLANLASAYSSNGQTEEAIATYWKALDLKPNDGLLRTALCKTLASAQRLDVALRECGKAVEDSPHYAPAFLAKGDVLRAQGKNDEAVAAYQKAFELAPKGDLKEEIRRHLLELGAPDPNLSGKKKDRWTLP